MSRSFAFTGAHITFRLRARRLAWHIVWLLLYRPSPRPFHAWRRLLLRAFGARIAAGAVPYAAARIWAPWNLTMAVNSCLSDDVDCYCVAPITIGPYATVSQYCYLCSASHDYRDPTMPLIIAPIVIGAEALGGGRRLHRPRRRHRRGRGGGRTLDGDPGCRCVDGGRGLASARPWPAPEIHPADSARSMNAADRSPKAIAVKVGLAAPIDGNTAVPTT